VSIALTFLFALAGAAENVQLQRSGGMFEVSIQLRLAILFEKQRLSDLR